MPVDSGLTDREEALHTKLEELEWDFTKLQIRLHTVLDLSEELLMVCVNADVLVDEQVSNARKVLKSIRQSL